MMNIGIVSSWSDRSRGFPNFGNTVQKTKWALVIGKSLAGPW